MRHILAAALLLAGVLCLEQQPQAYWQSRAQVGVVAAASGVTFDACATSSTSVVSAGALNNSNLTVGAGSNRVLVAFLSASQGAVENAVTAVWDSGGSNQSMTKMVSKSGSVGAAGGVVGIWGLVAPTSGNKLLAMSWNSGNSEAVLSACSFTGANQAGGATTFPNSATGTNTGATASSVVTSATGHMTVASFINVSTFTSPTQTQIFVDNAQAVLAYEAQRASGAATVTFNVTNSGSSVWDSAGLDIAP